MDDLLTENRDGNSACCKQEEESVTKKAHSPMQIILGLAGITFWYLIYQQLEPFSHFLTYNIWLLAVSSG